MGGRGGYRTPTPPGPAVHGGTFVVTANPVHVYFIHTCIFYTFDHLYILYMCIFICLAICIFYIYFIHGYFIYLAICIFVYILPE